MNQSRDNRREFERLTLSEEAVALDANGKDLGHISLAGGGGFLIHPATPEAIQKLKVGTRLRITVSEPGSTARNTFHVEVRYRAGEALGCQFIAEKKT